MLGNKVHALKARASQYQLNYRPVTYLNFLLRYVKITWPYICVKYAYRMYVKYAYMDIKYRDVNNKHIFLAVSSHWTGLSEELVFCPLEEPGNVKGAQCQTQSLERAFQPWERACGLWMTFRARHRFYSKSSGDSVRGKRPVSHFFFLKVEAKSGLVMLVRCGGD